MRDASIVDIVWGLGFVGVAWVAFAVADGSDARARWLAWSSPRCGGCDSPATSRGATSARERTIDTRRCAAAYGARFPLVSLFTVFGLQGVLMWIVSLPVQAAQVPDTPSGLVALDVVGLGLWCAGMFFETVGDLQLARFKADPRTPAR